MPEMTLLCGECEHIRTAVSVKMYRRYTEIMEKGENSTDYRTTFHSNEEILKEVFDVSAREIQRADIAEQLAAIKTIHFVMQEIVTPKFLDLNPEHPEQQEQEKSVFDKYDEENGYNDIPQTSIWKICKENTDRIVKLCVRSFNDSYTKCMEADIMSLLDYVIFEIKTIKENRE